MKTGDYKPHTRAADKMIDLGVETLATQGLSVAFENIRMEEFIAASGVSRATAYRRWPHREEFIGEVLETALHRISLIPEDDQDLKRLVEMVIERLDALATEQGRRNLVVEALRTSLDADIRRLSGSVKWQMMLSLSAAHHTLQPPRLRNRVAEALRSAEQQMDQRRAEIYGNLAVMVGYRLTHGQDFKAMAVAMGTMMKGVILRALPDPGWLDERHPAMMFDSTETVMWSQPEIMLTRVLLDHLEPNPSIEWNHETLMRSVRIFEQQVHLMMARSETDDLPGSDASDRSFSS